MQKNKNTGSSGVHHDRLLLYDASLGWLLYAHCAMQKYTVVEKRAVFQSAKATISPYYMQMLLKCIILLTENDPQVTTVLTRIEIVQHKHSTCRP